MAPMIDVTEVLLDPMVAGEGFQVIRRPEIVSQFGQGSVPAPVTLPAVGSIQPTSDNSLVREEAYGMQVKTIRVVTTFRLRGVSRMGQQNYQPDIVVWNGGRFIVRTVEDFSSYGAGMIQADCISENFVDPPPYAIPPTIGAMNFSIAANSGLIGAL